MEDVVRDLLRYSRLNGLHDETRDLARLLVTLRLRTHKDSVDPMQSHASNDRSMPPSLA